MTTWTNKAGLPQPLVDAIKFSDYDKVGDCSVTGLIQPPRIRQLTIRHSDEIIEDVSDNIWKLIGSIGHKIIERSNTDNHLAEERLTTQLQGWTISGKADLLNPQMKLSDYKFTSVWAVKYEKAEWTAQLNLYAWLYRQEGFRAESAEIVAILRDWSKPRAQREPDMPQTGVVVREVPLWLDRAQFDFVLDRVAIHQKATTLSDDDLPMCTDEERWKRPGKFAVMKKGNKRASKLFDDEVSAQAMAAATGYEVVSRPAAYPRCENYCSVKQFCSFGKTLMATEIEE